LPEIENKKKPRDFSTLLAEQKAFVALTVVHIDVTMATVF